MAKKVDHTHGDNGTKPADNLNFQTGDKPDPETFDWFWSEVPAAINDHADELDAIDADFDSDAVDAVDAEVDAAATSVATLDDTVSSHDHSNDSEGELIPDDGLDKDYQQVNEALPTASEGDSASEAGILAYDPTEEQLLISK